MDAAKWLWTRYKECIPLPGGLSDGDQHLSRYPIGPGYSVRHLQMQEQNNQNSDLC